MRCIRANKAVIIAVVVDSELKQLTEELWFVARQEREGEWSLNSNRCNFQLSAHRRKIV